MFFQCGLFCIYVYYPLLKANFYDKTYTSLFLLILKKNFNSIVKYFLPFTKVKEISQIKLKKIRKKMSTFTVPRFKILSDSQESERIVIVILAKSEIDIFLLSSRLNSLNICQICFIEPLKAGLSKTQIFCPVSLRLSLVIH